MLVSIMVCYVSKMILLLQDVIEEDKGWLSNAPLNND